MDAAASGPIPPSPVPSSTSPAIATSATEMALRVQFRLTTVFAFVSALAVAVPAITQVPVGSSWRFAASVIFVAGLVGLPWSMVVAVRVRLVQQLLVAQPWVARWVDFRVDPSHGFGRKVEVLIRDDGKPVFDGITKGRRMDRRARGAAEAADGIWWVCSDRTGTFVLSPLGGDVLVPARKLRAGPLADRTRRRFGPRGST